MDDSTIKKSSTTPIMITLLIIIALLQALILIGQNRRTDDLNKKQTVMAGSDSPRQIARRALRANAYPLPSQMMSNPVSRGLTSEKDPWEEFDAMSRRMNSLMQHAFVFGSPVFQSISGDAGFELTPAIDLEETKDAYIVKSDLPGLEKDQIQITVKDNILTIKGVQETSSESKDPQKGYYTQERSYGSFSRSLPLPGRVDESKISASYTNGVLTITLPKDLGEKTVPKKVTVQ